MATALFYVTENRAFAANAANWQAGRIIDDGVFANRDGMSVEYIQNFLNQKVGAERGNPYSVPGVCDTNGTKTSEYGGGTRAQYGAANNNPAPFTCLKDYYEVPKVDPAPGIPASNYGGAPIPAGAKSAAQIIWDAAQRYSINPKVLLVLIQKESAGPLITDDWPFKSQYTYAMGAHCPDTAPCDENYAGFSMQVHESARLFRYYITNMNQPWWTYKKPGINSILYNPNSNCGSSNVNIETYATAALYTYTPYQPNQAALNNLYGSAPPCGAYGNRNFWRYFIDWFGSTQTEVPFAWMLESQEAFIDSARTQPFTSHITVEPGAKIYLKIRARNIGSQAWAPSFLRLGTSGPRDRQSELNDESWLGPTRPASLLESGVEPGQIGTFNFVLKAPLTPGNTKEYFNLVADGYTWLNDPGVYFDINFVSPTSATGGTGTLNPGESITSGNYIISPDTHSLLAVQPDGNVVLYSNFSRVVWFANTQNKAGAKLIMQPDGNLVLYTQANVPVWSSETAGNPGARLTLQTDGNLVIYTSSNTPIWDIGHSHIPNHLSYVNTELHTGSLVPPQTLETPSRKYKLVLQADSNLVLYSNSSPVWASGTSGRNVSHLAMQADGNLVLYDKSGSVVWHTNTFLSKTSKLVIQPDGNLVLYNTVQATWSSNTAGL